MTKQNCSINTYLTAINTRWWT